MSNNFDPLAIKLQGLHLIEASAGTGKTYALTTLYLRLLLERNLHPNSILVVTFTKAATEALRERVRSRIVEALIQLEHPNKIKQSDAELNKLLNRISNTVKVKKVLIDALAHIDEAAIFTIHSFCQQMLQDYAFESGTSFAAELITDETNLLHTAMADVWRQKLGAASIEEVAWIVSHWSNPWKFLAEIQTTLYQNDLQLIPQLDLCTTQQEVATILTIINRIRASWEQAREPCLKLLADNPNLHKTYYKAAKVQALCVEMNAFAKERHLPHFLPKCVEFLRAETLSRFTLKGKQTPQHPFFDLCNTIEATGVERANRRWKAAWLQEARQQIQELLSRAKTEQELWSFDDLLKNLDAVLAKEPTVNILANIICKRFPVALIDEFQDTDSKQYRIFSRIYATCPECGLFLIGDPKQAIYAFRGADVFTYMQAKLDAVNQQAEHTLNTNWRSNSRLITAINTIFSNAPQPFWYKNIPFHKVDSGEIADKTALTVHGDLVTPLQFWILDSVGDTMIKIPDANREAARACAEYIANLLRIADAGKAKLGNKAVRSKDIAILVKTHREGDQIQAALNACNVGCVTLSQDSVFATEQAEELNIILTAVVRYDDIGWLKAALATTLLGWNALQIASLSNDVEQIEELKNKFKGYYQQWRERSFITFFQQLLIKEKIPQRLLQLQAGERQLTNVLQLSELLQAAALECVEPRELLRWLELQRNNEQKVDETKQLRLESDENLVQVVTMHKSKGLEYPIVFIPFPWSLKPHKQSTSILFHEPNNFTLSLDLGSDDQAANKILQSQEALAEQMRLFYVAITRAKQLCVLCWGWVNTAEDSAPALLLHPNRNLSQPATTLKHLNADAVRADLEILATTASSCIQILDLPAPTGIRWQGVNFDPHALSVAKFTGTIDNRWIVASYSGLTRGEDSQQPDYDANVMSNEVQVVEPDNSTVDPIFAFPAGAEAGLFLHTVLERLDFVKATSEHLLTVIQNLLPNFGSLSRNLLLEKNDWSRVAVDMIMNCLHTPLLATTSIFETLRLRDISWNNRLSELEFHYRISHLTPDNLSAALAPFPKYHASVAGLEFKPFEGLMHGFVDLIFRHHNRYYIVDYKSNRLGMNLMDYNQTGMYNAIRSHRYDLQYLIYTLALHRFLQQRMLGYSYAQHFGGILYLFLRGMRPDLGADYGVYFDRPQYQVIENLDTRL